MPSYNHDEGVLLGFFAKSARAVSVMCLTTATLHAQAGAILAARIDSVFARYTPATPGCELLVRQNGTTLLERAYGRASLELGVPISSRTVFNVGSLSKQFTAASIVLLAQDGKLSLDDDIRTFVPELPILDGKVTLRQLLTHTSGWRDYIQLLVWQGHEVRDHVTPLDAMNVLRTQRALNFAPGTEFRYSNTGYYLMSLVVQRVTGDSLPEFARKRIFEPLGMHDTRYVTDMRAVVEDRAIAYEPAPKGAWREAMSGWEMAGAGGVYTTAGDLARWDDALTSGVLGNRALTDALVTAGKLRDGVSIPYGLGLFVDRYLGQRRVWHNGIWAGYRSILMRFPDARVSIIALCNAADATSESLADAVARIVLPVPQPATGAAVERAPTPDATLLSGLYYGGSTNQRVTIGVDSGVLSIAGSPATHLIAGRARTFRLPGSTTILEFKPANDTARTMISHSDGRSSVYARVGPPLPPSSFLAYRGRYHSDELGVDWTVDVRGDQLSLVDGRGDRTNIQPIFRDAFAGPGTVRFERDAGGKVVALTMTTTGVYLLRFMRRGGS